MNKVGIFLCELSCLGVYFFIFSFDWTGAASKMSQGKRREAGIKRRLSIQNQLKNWNARYLINSKSYYTIHSFFICYWNNDEAAMFHNKTNKWSREKDPIAYNSFRLVVNWIESERCMWTEHKNKDIEWALASRVHEQNGKILPWTSGKSDIFIFHLERIKRKKEKQFNFCTNEREWVRGAVDEEIISTYVCIDSARIRLCCFKYLWMVIYNERCHLVTSVNNNKAGVKTSLIILCLFNSRKKVGMKIHSERDIRCG